MGFLRIALNHIPRAARQSLIAFATTAVFCCIGNPFLQPQAAADDIDNFSCSNGAANGNFFSADVLTTTVSDPTSPTGPGIAVTVGGTCTATMGVVGRVLCYFKSTLGQIMSSMYCSFQAAMIGPLAAALTLFVIIFGILIITGMVRFTVKEAGLALFKIALIWVFATNASYGIGYGYKFFLTGAEEGVSMVTNALASPGSGQCASATGPTTPSPLSPASVDVVATNLINNTAGISSNAGGNGAAAPADDGTITLPFNDASCNPIKISKYCAQWLAGGTGMLVFFLPVATLFAGNIVLQYFFLYVRAMLGYLTALVIISFLFILSPLFISFALFKVTKKLFEQWLKHLIAFSLQIIVIFAFLAMVQLVLTPLTTFFGQVLPLFKEYDFRIGKGNVMVPEHACSFCQYQITDNSAALSTITSTPTSSWTSPSSIACTSGTAASSGSSGGSTDTTNAGYVQAVNSGGASGTNFNVIPLSNLLQHGDLIMFLVSNALALWLIASVLQDFLKRAPEIARQIGGLPYAAGLMGEAPTTPDIGGVKFAGFEAAEKSITSAGESLVNNPWVRGGLAAAPMMAVSRASGATTGDTVRRTTPDAASRPTPDPVAPVPPRGNGDPHQ